MTTYSADVGDVTSIDLDESDVNIIGASWTGTAPDFEIRYQQNGAWSSWERLDVDDAAGPDAGTAEDKQLPSTEGETDAVPVVDATRAEVRSTATASADADVTITKVATPVTADDEALAKRSVPSGVTAYKYNSGLKANIVTRAEWGADESLVRCKSGSTSTAKGVAIHHTAGSNSYTRAEAPGIIRGYLKYHTQTRGWCDLGYNFLVDKYGVIYEGRAGSIDRAITGAHASGFNSYTIGVSVLGTYSSAAPSTEAQNSVKRVIAWKANQYGFSPTGKMTLTSGGGDTSRYPAGKQVTLDVVFGHRDTSYTDCPGTAYYNRLGAIRSGAKALQSELKGEYPTGGAIGQYYTANKAKTGKPTSEERRLTNPDGAYQVFERGVVYWSKASGAHFNTGGIRTAYKALGYEKGMLGFPTKDEVQFTYRAGAYYQNFQRGIITWSSTTKGQPLAYGMLTKWRELGWERSKLGLPTSGEYSSAGKTRQDFEGGYMTWTAKEGVKVYYKQG